MLGHIAYKTSGTLRLVPLHRTIGIQQVSVRTTTYHSLTSTTTTPARTLHSIRSNPSQAPLCSHTRLSPAPYALPSKKPFSTSIRTTMASTTNNIPPANNPAVAATGKAAKKAPKEKPDQTFAPTLLLPKTDFPLRSGGAAVEAQFRPRCTSELYCWQREHNPGELFVLHDGPPYANGNLHLGHALNKLIKDFVNRQKVLKGHKVDYRPGWDCHGLPIELKALSALKANKSSSSSDGKTTADVSALTPTEVRETARKFALEAIANQKKDFLSYGIMGDFDNGYQTLDKDYETRQLTVFHRMMKKGLIYRANKPVYWSPSSRTALAEAELEYKDDHKSRSAWVAFETDQPSAKLASLLPPKTTLEAVVWTTTPWTLPANRAVAVHPKLSYTLFKASTGGADKVYLAATERMDEMHTRFAKKQGEDTVMPQFELLGQLTGAELLGSKYKHPMTGETMPFIAADYVSADSGSGLVHTAPGHGMDDYKACLPLRIDAFCPVDDLGKFTNEAGPELGGLAVQGDGTAKVLEMLSEKGSLIHEHNYLHKYPYDWRTKKPVILRATSQWFANVGSIKEDALKAIEGVRILPDNARGRLNAFVQSRSEWCISRQRSWGVPIPVMYDTETDEPLLTDASVGHIIDVVKQHGTDAWWSMSTDELLAPEYRNNGRTYRRGYDTMDVWFDSGTSWTMIEEKMPRPHLPYVADVYSEGSDQHRGWFQSSLLTSVALTGKAPYATLITHGFLLDAKGFKQSKSVGNTVEPSIVIFGGKNLQKDPAYGTDVLRLWAASSEYTKDVAIGKTILTQVQESVRKFRNTARFMLGNLQGFHERDSLQYDQLSKLDQFMLSEVYQFGKAVEAGYDDHMFHRVFTQLQYLTSTTLSSLYLDVVKDSLYSDPEKSQQRRAIQTVLFHTLNAFNKSLSPLAPHLGEEVYQHYRDCFTTPQPSVFRTGWLHLPEEWNNKALVEDFRVLRHLRQEANQLLEQARTAKMIRSSLEADLELHVPANESSTALATLAEEYKDLLAKLFITSDVTLVKDSEVEGVKDGGDNEVFVREVMIPRVGSCKLVARKAALHKCPRCWKYVAETEGHLCARCEPVVREVAPALL